MSCTPADPRLKGPARDKGWHSVTETKLRIGVDIATLRPPFTGIANYELQLLSRLVPSMPEISFLGYRIYRWEEVNEAFLASCVSEETPLPAGRKSPLRYSTLVHAMRNQVRETVFSASVSAKNISLYHAFSYRPPGRIKAPVIPVVYDLSTVRHRKHTQRLASNGWSLWKPFAGTRPSSTRSRSSARRRSRASSAFPATGSSWSIRV